jgi:hypothetical protein
VEGENSLTSVSTIAKMTFIALENESRITIAFQILTDQPYITPGPYNHVSMTIDSLFSGISFV